MERQACVVRLPGANNYALISEGRIAFGLGATEDELEILLTEEKAIKEDVVLVDGETVSAKVASISLIPTFDCNLRCLYCYARGGDTKEYLSLEKAKVAIRSVGISEGFDRLNLYLVGGGEPFMNFELIQESVAFAEGLYKSVGIYVVTNGTFGDRVLSWLIKHDVNTRVSYDGVMQDADRPYADGLPSSPVIRNNIERLIEAGISTIVQCVVTQEGLSYLIQTIQQIQKLGVEVIKLEPVIPTGISRDCRGLVPNPLSYSKALLGAIDFVSEHDLKIKIDTGFFSKPSTGFYCGISNPNRIITPHGLVTACVEIARSTDPYAEYLIYGEVSRTGLVLDNFKAGRFKELRFENYGICGTCNLRLICQGGCPMANIWKTGLPPKQSVFTCAVEHALLPPLLLKLATNPRVADIILDEAEVAVC